jgi:antitoxin HicB
MHFPARFEPQPEGGFLVTMRDLPEVLTEGETLEEAMHNAQEALQGILEVRQEFGLPVPQPSLLEAGEYLVGLKPNES